MSIPLVDLHRQHVEIAEEIEAGIRNVMQHGGFIRGPELAQFEAGFAAFSGTRHCVGVASGTDALELAVRALGLGRGDEVILPANSFIASALAVLRAGVDVVLVDADPVTHLMDVEAVADVVGPRTRAVMPVHLFGQMADVSALAELVGDIPIIEDAAQSQGAERDGVSSGSLGRIAATSFYPGKNIGAYGDGGAVLTNDDELATSVRALGNWGSDIKYQHPVIGFNSRLDTIQAVVLIAKLKRLARWNELRRSAADCYYDLLSGAENVVLPSVDPGNVHVWHLYVIRVAERDAVLEKLHRCGIGAGVHYPIPMHLQPALSDLEYGQGSFPVAEASANEMLSLPMFPGITQSEQEIVVEALLDALKA